MTTTQLAALIPAEYRKEILLTNMISKAQAVAGDTSMGYLFTIWKNYVEPTISEGCNMCYVRVLNNFKGLQETFVLMEKEKNLLDEVGLEYTGSNTDAFAAEWLKDLNDKAN